MTIPTVSILILTYNRLEISSKYIPRILDNIGNIPNEVLIWDNESHDGTYDWLSTYKRADPRITRVFGNEKNIGVEAINHLAEVGSGKFIIKLDDDIKVPKNFAIRMVEAFEKVAEDKLLFLSWDMNWEGGKTFATRSGMKLYKDPLGKIVGVNSKERVLINFDISKWLINGACRLSPRDKFLEIGGHPKGVIYGVDYLVSKQAAKNGYWGGYFNSPDLVIHKGVNEELPYRKFKDKELEKHGAPKHV